MSKRLKKWMYVFISALVLFGMARLYYRLTDDFRIANITYQLPFKAPWQIPVLTTQEHQELSTIFNQKFSYIGKGAQCYAFASEDQQYVLKFFKFKHLKPNLFVDLMPSLPPFKDFKQKCIERKKRKLIGVFNGYDLAYREHRQESKLLYLHLVATQNLNLQATVIDKIGMTHHINLDHVVFLVQRKGETLRTRLSHLLNQGKVEEAKQTLSHILTMYVSEYKKGLFDHDHGVMQNTGFVGDQPFHLDVGKLNKDEQMRQLAVYKKDLQYVIWKMDFWIKTSYPLYHAPLSNFLEHHYQERTGETLDIQALDSKNFKRSR